MIIAADGEQSVEMMHATRLAAHGASRARTTDRLLDQCACLPGGFCVAITANVEAHLGHSRRVSFRVGLPDVAAERKVEAQRSQLIFDLAYRKRPRLLVGEHAVNPTTEIVNDRSPTGLDEAVRPGYRAVKQSRVCVNHVLQDWIDRDVDEALLCALHFQAFRDLKACAVR
jgi:hypothetical protein